jgi:di/tricarboxylate transporter
MTIGHRLLPERVPPRETYIEEYEIGEYLTEVTVREESPLVGKTVEEAIDAAAFDADILRLVRDDETFGEPLGGKVIRPGDALLIRTDKRTLNELAALDALTLRNGGASAEATAEVDLERSIVEVVVPRDSYLVGESLSSSTFRQRYDANVLAFRSRGETVRERMDEIEIRAGDTLLVEASSDSIDRLASNRDFIVAHEADEPDYRSEKIPVTLAIMVGVVALPALGILPIVATSLAGVVAMVAAGVLRANELYDSVEWSVIFLLAGVIPLGIALERTGAADLLGGLVASSADFLPLVVVLWVFYIATGLITEIISNNASVVLMIPVAVAAATEIGANPFAFVLAVTFAASTAFLGPVGYQTNLFVYGPGGYKFTDYFRVGAPLQLLLSVVTVAGIVAFWGLRPA